MPWWRRAPKEPSLVDALARLASRVDTIESNAARDSHDDATATAAALKSISDRIDRIGREQESGFKLIAESLIVNQTRLEQRQTDYEYRTDQRLTALEARKELTP